MAIEERFSQIEAAARSRVDQTGDSNPKAVQRHYDTLKNTYINLEMKEVFLDGTRLCTVVWSQKERTLLGSMASSRASYLEVDC